MIKNQYGQSICPQCNTVYWEYVDAQTVKCENCGTKQHLNKPLKRPLESNIVTHIVSIIFEKVTIDLYHAIKREKRCQATKLFDPTRPENTVIDRCVLEEGHEPFAQWLVELRKAHGKTLSEEEKHLWS